MTVNELAVILNRHLETNGDCDILIYPIDIGSPSDIDEVAYLEEDKFLALVGHH